MTGPAVAGASAGEPAVVGPSRLVLLLGPQGSRPTLASHLAAHGLEGRVATVTAGWQEREDEVQALQTHLDGRSINLRLHARAEELFREDPDLAAAHRERQEKLRRLRTLYDVRLAHGMEAALELARRPGDDPVLEEQRAASVESVRALDAEHLAAVRRIHAEYAPRLALDERPAVRRHREEVAALVEQTQAIALAGGHVAVLLNRLRLFDVPGPADDRPLVGWSAGAMVLAERVVLYHDSPPQGAGNAEVFEEGRGRVRNVVPLPHAARRLLLDDRVRVARFARRFAPARCFALDDGAALALEESGWGATPETRELFPDGGVGEVAA
jgi:hypothetical protein